MSVNRQWLISREISAGRTVVHNRGNLGTVQGTSRLYEVVLGKPKKRRTHRCMVSYRTAGKNEKKNDNLHYSTTAKSTKSSQFDVLTMRLPFQKKEKR